MNRVVSASELIGRLEVLRNDAPSSALAFDGDGTLWSGDVGEDVFEYTVERNWIRSDARAPLDEMLRRYEIAPCTNAPSDAARALLVGFREGRVSHYDACELMTWSYAGFAVDELASVARQALEARRFGERIQPELEPILAWSRASGVRAVIVSASPRIIVEIAAAGLGFEPGDIVAADPVIRNRRIGAAMERPLPFGITKRQAGEALLAGSRWLATFGDSDYDVDMMNAAMLGVAVRPKPSLRALLEKFPDILVLSRMS